MGAMRSVVKIKYKVDADESEDEEWYGDGCSSEESVREVAIAALRPEGVSRVVVAKATRDAADRLRRRRRTR